MKSREWASSVDLHVALASGGRRAGLERAIRAAIRNGRLEAGERLPSTRALASDLGLARGTVAEAYAQLAAEGYLLTRQGAPARVAPGALGAGDTGRRAGGAPSAGDTGGRARGAPSAADTGRRARGAPSASDTGGRARGAPSAADTATPAGGADAPRFALRPGVPDLGAFPRAEWISALRRALASAPAAALAPDDPRGRPELRAALSAYLGRARGVLAEPERIVVCAGFVEGLALLASALRARGVTTVAMEDPGLRDHREIAAAGGLRVAPLPVDECGAVADVPAGAGAVVLTPAHQFPLGATLAPERRAAFAGWARARDAIVIEDDYDGEFRYDRQPVGALQGLDPERVVYAGTASKTLAPALRLGWLVVPAALLDDVVAAKRLAGPTHVLGQLALAELIRSGAFDRHVRRMRQRYRRRRDRLLALLDGRAPQPRGIAAGLHLVLETAEDELIAAAERHSLALHGLRPYWHAGEGPPGIVLGYGSPAGHELEATLDRLLRGLTP